MFLFPYLIIGTKSLYKNNFRSTHSSLSVGVSTFDTQVAVSIVPSLIKVVDFDRQTETDNKTQKIMDHKPNYEQVPYQAQTAAYPHPQPPPAYDASTQQHPGLYPQVPPYPMDNPHPVHHSAAPPPTTIIQSELAMQKQYKTPHLVYNAIIKPSISQFAAVYQPQVGPEPTGITCPSCRQSIVTNLDYETTTKTHIFAGICCIFGWGSREALGGWFIEHSLIIIFNYFRYSFWPCAWIPYVMDSCKNANHYCPNCGAFIGTYQS